MTTKAGSDPIRDNEAAVFCQDERDARLWGRAGGRQVGFLLDKWAQYHNARSAAK